MDILDGIASKIARGKAVLFIGAGLSVGVGLPSWRHLASELASEIGCSTTASPLDIAQYYENERGRHELHEKLRSQIKERPVSYSENHRKLASLGFRVVITTNYDRLLEEALRASGYEVHVVVSDIDVSYWDEEQEVQVLKLHGDIENADSIVITRTDYSSFFRTHPGITHRLRAILLDCPLIFVGYNLEDPDFNFILDEITFDLQGHRPPSYFVGFNIDKFRQKDLEQRGIRVMSIPIDISESGTEPQEPYNEALGKLLDELSSRTEARSAEKIRRVTKGVEEYSVANEVRDLLQVMGYKVSETDGIGSRRWLLAEKRSEGKHIKRLTLCSSSDLGSGDVDAMLAKIGADPDADGWLVAPSNARISREAHDLAGTSDRVQVLSLAQFYAQMVPFEDYLELLVREYESSDIPRYYVDLGARKPQFDVTRSSVIREDSFKPIDEYIDSWLGSSDQNHVSILGDYGTGKTWFCRRYAAKQAKRYLADPEHNRIPILIPLRDFTKTLKIEPLVTDALVNTYGLQLGGGFATFQHLNRYGRLLVIFDGFDEMESKVDEIVTVQNFEELAKAVAPGGKSKVILTCRTPYFQSNLQELALLTGEGEEHIDLKSRPNFDIMYLEPFDDEQIKEALRKRVSESWEYYYQQIKSTYDLPNLARRPVMIEMIVDTLPDVKDLSAINPAVLYQKYTDKWIKKNIEEERTFLDADSKRIFMEELAWEMYRTGSLRLHYTDIPGKVQSHFGLSTKVTVDYYEHDIRAQSYLVRDHEGQYVFAHKSFMEFFIAQRILRSIREDDQSLLAERGLRMEVYDFLVHMLGQEDILRVYSWLDTSHDSKVRRTCIILLRLLGDSVACESLAKVYNEDPQPSIRRRAAKALKSIGGEKVNKILLEGMRHQTDGRVLRTVMEALDQIEDTSMVPMLEDVARNRLVDDNGRRGAMEMLARFGEREKVNALATACFNENLELQRKGERKILEILDKQVSSEIANKIVRSSRPSRYKLGAIQYLSDDMKADVVPYVIDLLATLRSDLDYAKERTKYPHKVVNTSKRVVAKCRAMADLPEIMELCDSIESQIAELNKRFPAKGV